MELESEFRRMLLDLHRDEYQIQSTRITYWITLQYATYTITAIGLGFLLQAFGSIQPLTIALTATLLGQVFVLAMIHVNQEMFGSVIYIEQHLKPKVRELLGEHGSAGFWEYEKHLAAERKAQSVKGFEVQYVLMAILALVVMIGIVSVIWTSLHVLSSWTKLHFFWLFCNVCVSLMIVAKLPEFIRMQRSMLGGHE